MGWGEKAIEIRSVSQGLLDGVFMHKRANKLKFLCERNDKVFFASVQSPSNSQGWCLKYCIIRDRHGLYPLSPFFDGPEAPNNKNWLVPNHLAQMARRPCSRPKWREGQEGLNQKKLSSEKRPGPVLNQSDRPMDQRKKKGRRLGKMARRPESE